MQLGPFQLETLLGRGATGEVWRATHDGSGEQVALKRLAPDRADASAFLVRREVEAVARLDHPGVVWIHDHGEDDAHGPWIAYELASGGTLADRLPTDWGALRALLQELLAALRHAHARGVLHRDLKPGNVLLCTLDDARPGPKLADFSLARVGARRGTAGGTPGYAAPEQREGRWRDEGPWTDLYALGALAWTATCGAPPDATAWRPNLQVPGAFVAWVERLLAAEPERRYTSAAAATEALRATPSAGSAPGRERFTFDQPLDAAAPRPHPRRSAASLGLFGLRPIPVVDRHAEQSRVRAALRAAESDGGPVVLRWLGEAGVGKTRLLEWVGVTAREADRAVVIEAALGSRDLADALRRPWAGALAWRRAAASPRVRAYLEGGDDDVVELFAEWTQGYGAPVVLLLDEVPAAGRAERQLGELSRRCGPAVVVVGAGREGQPTAGVVDVPLGRLSESGALARALGVADASLAHELGRRGDGVPSLIVASVREAVRSGALAPGPDGWVATRPLDPGLPGDVAAALQRRLPVGGADRAALELLALCGPGATAEAWSTSCARSGVAWSPALADQLRRAGLVVADPHPRVADGLLRERLLEGLGAGDDLASRVALVAEVLGTPDDPEALRHLGRLWVRAGQHLRGARLLFAASVHHQGSRSPEWRLGLLDAVDAALAHEPDAALASDVALWRAASWAVDGQVERALALVEAHTPVGPFSVWRHPLMLAQLRAWVGRAHGALDAAERSNAAATEPDQRRYSVAVHGGVLHQLGRLDEALEVMASLGAVVSAAAVGTVAQCLMERGRLDEAEGALMALMLREGMAERELHCLQLRFRRGQPTFDLLQALVDATAATPNLRARSLGLLALVAAHEEPDQLAAIEARAREVLTATRLRDRSIRLHLSEAASLAPPGLAERLLDLAVGQELADGPTDPYSGAA